MENLLINYHYSVALDKHTLSLCAYTLDDIVQYNAFKHMHDSCLQHFILNVKSGSISGIHYHFLNMFLDFVLYQGNS